MVNSDMWAVCDNQFAIALCKTWLCVEVMRIKRRVLRACDAMRIVYTSFESDEVASDSNPAADFSSFLHIAGSSDSKNSKAAVFSWSYRFGRLTVAKHQHLLDAQLAVWATPSIDFHAGVISSAKRNDLMRSSGIHVCPSALEGFGHYVRSVCI